MKLTQVVDINTDKLKLCVSDLLTNLQTSQCFLSNLKDLYMFYNWFLNSNHSNNFTTNDMHIIRNNEYSQFPELSPDCSITNKNTITEFVEFIWQKRIQNIFLNDGYNVIPVVTCKSIPFPKEISRENETLLMSMFYKNNLLNSSLFQINPRKYTNPFCSFGCSDLETSYHIMAACNNNPHKNEIMNTLIQAFGSDVAHIDSHITLLNVKNNFQFLELCLLAMSVNPHLRKTIIL